MAEEGAWPKKRQRAINRAGSLVGANGARGTNSARATSGVVRTMHAPKSVSGPRRDVVALAQLVVPERQVTLRLEVGPGRDSSFGLNAAAWRLAPSNACRRLLSFDRSGSGRWTLGRRTLLLASPSVEVPDGRLYTFVPGHDPVAHRPKEAAERVDAGVEPRSDNPGLAALDTDGNPAASGWSRFRSALGRTPNSWLTAGSASIV